ncbi:MAG: shikimate dehydrogenase, partial [Nocardioides sp.]|nr:shikimate dehydrogenase [Nocardioides sp.]
TGAGTGRRCAVLGDPIDHSLSPTLHQAGYAELGLDWTYTAHRVDASALGAFLDGCDESWRGLSLTMPLKRSVMELVDEVSERARMAGAANTVVLDGGRRRADNTDIPGAMAAIRERYDGRLVSATILGGGATAASIGLALCELGVETLRLLARSPARAEETRRVIAAHPSAPRVEIGSLGNDQTTGDLITGDLVASTVPADAQTLSLISRCTQVPVVFDALYAPWPTPLAASVVGADRVLVGGLDLLVHQAALQFEMFTGETAPLAEMRAAGEAALAR